MQKNPKLKKIIFKIIENQLRDNDPPETRKTLQRLIKEGYEEDSAKELIGCVVTTVIYDVLKNEQTYNRLKYVKALDKLPQLPWQ